VMDGDMEMGMRKLAVRSSRFLLTIMCNIQHTGQYEHKQGAWRVGQMRMRMQHATQTLGLSASAIALGHAHTTQTLRIKISPTGMRWRRVAGRWILRSGDFTQEDPASESMLVSKHIRKPSYSDCVKAHVGLGLYCD
jgi:hypothetical protein